MARLLCVMFMLPALLAASFTAAAKTPPTGGGGKAGLIVEFRSTAAGGGTGILLTLGTLLSTEEAAGLIALPPGGERRSAAEYQLLAAALGASLGARCRLHEGRLDEGKVAAGKLSPAIGAAVDFLSEHADWRLRLAAAGLLPCLDGEITPAHRRLAADSEWPVKHLAIASLAALPAGENIVILDGILRDSGDAFVSARVEAVRAIDRLRYLPGLLKALGDSSPEVRLHALWGLERFPVLPDRAKPALENLLAGKADEGERAEIRRLLERRPPPAMEGAL